MKGGKPTYPLWTPSVPFTFPPVKRFVDSLSKPFAGVDSNVKELELQIKVPDSLVLENKETSRCTTMVVEIESAKSTSLRSIRNNIPFLYRKI